MPVVGMAFNQHLTFNSKTELRFEVLIEFMIELNPPIVIVDASFMKKRLIKEYTRHQNAELNTGIGVVAIAKGILYNMGFPLHTDNSTAAESVARDKARAMFPGCIVFNDAIWTRDADAENRYHPDTSGTLSRKAHLLARRALKRGIYISNVYRLV